MTDTFDYEGLAAHIRALHWPYATEALRTRIQAAFVPVEDHRQLERLHDGVQDVAKAALARAEAAEARNTVLVEALRSSTERLEAVLAAMDRYNEKNGTAIIGPSLIGCGKQIAANRQALGAEHETD